MLDRRRDARLALEALAERDVPGEVRRDHLQRHRPLERELRGAVHHPHPAAAHDPLDAAAREQGPCREFGHRGHSPVSITWRARACAHWSPEPRASSAGAWRPSWPSAAIDVRALVRNEARAGRLAERGYELHVGDVLDADSLSGAGSDVDVAYYLVHSMGRGETHNGFADRERRAAANFGALARREGIERVVYLGGLGDLPDIRASAQSRPDGDGAGPRGAAAHLLPRRHGDRAQQRELPHPAPSGRAAARDDRARLAAQPHPADRDRRRARVPRPGRRAPGQRRPGGADRRPRRGHLLRPDRPHGRRARRAPAPPAAGAAAVPAPVLALDRARDPGGRRRGEAAGGEPGGGDRGERPLRPRALRRAGHAGSRGAQARPRAASRRSR